MRQFAHRAKETGSAAEETAAAAWLVFTKLGVGLLRKSWFNVDLIWAVALIATVGVDAWLS